MPFHKTTTFIVCVVLLVAVIILLIILIPKTLPYAILPNTVELAQHRDTQKPLSCALKWDFAVIPVYTAGFSLLCYIVGRFADDLNLVPLRFTKVIIAIVIVGVFFDVAENVALLLIIDGSSQSIWKSVAHVGGCAKFFSPILGDLYSLVLGIWCVSPHFLSRRR